MAMGVNKYCNKINLYFIAKGVFAYYCELTKMLQFCIVLLFILVGNDINKKCFEMQAVFLAANTLSRFELLVLFREKFFYEGAQRNRRENKKRLTRSLLLLFSISARVMRLYFARCVNGK